jgi:hypothetical protein
MPDDAFIQCRDKFVWRANLSASNSGFIIAISGLSTGNE